MRQLLLDNATIFVSQHSRVRTRRSIRKREERRRQERAGSGEMATRGCVSSVDVFACRVRHVRGKPEICFEIRCVMEDGSDVFLSKTHKECLTVSKSSREFERLPLDPNTGLRLKTAGWFSSFLAKKMQKTDIKIIRIITSNA